MKPGLTQLVGDSIKLAVQFILLTKLFSIYRSSAGSGKTRTLAKAYLKLALQFRADYFKHILAVTFTNKASQEMKDRILEYLDDFTHGKSHLLAGEIQHELSMDSLTFRQHSEETQSTLLHQYDNFSICTIDAFFQKVIRSFTREAGLVGDYRLEIDQDAVLEEVIDNLIDELGSNRELTEWVVDFAKENLENERAWDVRYSLINFAREIFREEFKEIEDEISTATSAKDFFKALRSSLLEIKISFMREACVPAREILEIVKGNGWEPGDFSYGKNSGLFTFIGQFASGGNLSKYKAPGERIRNYFSDPLKWANRKSQYASRISSLAASTMVPALIRIINCYDEKFRSALSAEIALKNMYVFGLITDISRKLKEYKDENNLMLLADAPKFLNGVIRDSDTPFIYEKVGSFYRNYLIDEFQDTSGLQWQNFQPLIVNSLDQGYPSLVVGDVKQAIYRWRGGDLSLLQERIVNLLGEHRVDIQELDNNFRSAREIVNFNNAFFMTASQILSLESETPDADLAYKDVVQSALKLNAGFVEVRFLDAEESPERAPTESWKGQALRQVPAILERLQENGAALKDIAILVRKNDEGQQIAAYLLQYKNSPEAKKNCAYDVVSNESLRIDGAACVNLLLGALRYLLNADDSIARAQLGYEFARLHEPDRELSEVFAVSSQAIFENNLPPAFTRQKPALKKLPLIELTETLIEIFGLGRITGELVYLQTFQDLVLEFTNRERNDLATFLEWWETIRHKKSIQISGEVNAAQILTIHKSKGLQFKYVIIPFCSWNLDHDTWQAPNLWVKSDQGPFANAGYLPVPYGKNLEDTFFSSYYVQERTRILLDNLNLLYVAFTRAESGLIACAPSPDMRGSKGAIAGLLHQSIQANEQLRANWDERHLTYRLGEWEILTNPGKPDPTALQLGEYLSSRWRDKLVIRQTGSFWFEDSVAHEKISYGIYMHAVLSRMKYAGEMEAMLEQIVFEGFVNGDERAPLREQLIGLLENPTVANWFSRDWEVRTEIPIILPGGDGSRIDRLITRGSKAVVIDFKTGTRKKMDEKQVLDYMDILRKMNFLEVEGYLLYLVGNVVAQVKPGGKARLVQKQKDKDQLDLRF